MFIALPYGDNWHCDLVVAGPNRQLLKIQVKYGNHKDEYISFNTCSQEYVTGNKVKSTAYTADDIDALIVYDNINDVCYYIPVEEIEGKTLMHLRFAPTLNKQEQGIRWAKDFLHLPVSWL